MTFPSQPGGRDAGRSDDELAAAARSGDTDATEALLRSHLARIHATCRRLCRDPGDAEDAAQESLIAIVRGLPRFDGRSSVSSWIYRITTNACMDELRRRRRRPVPEEPSGDPAWAEISSRGSGQPAAPGADRGSDPADAAVASELRAQLADALGELPEDYRVAVVLRDVADLEYSTIAEVLGVPVGTVRSRIARGRGRLADLLGPRPDGDHPPEGYSGDSGTESARDASKGMEQK